MKIKVILTSVFASLVWLSSVSAQRQVPVQKRENASPATTAKLSQAYGKLPLAFEANRGQSDGRVQFLARGNGYALFLTGQETVLKLRPHEAESQSSKSAVIRMKLPGAKTSPKIVGLHPLPGKSNYFLGNDPNRWQTGVESFAQVKYEAVYPGVDLIWYGNQRQLEYDFVVAPGARTETIKIVFEGAQKLKLAEDGSLILRAEGRKARMLKPLAWQEIDGQRREVPCDYRLKGNQVRFQLGKYDVSHPLVIDPVLVYSTFIGGAGFDEAYGVAVDGQGNAYLAGITDSADFPSNSPIQPTKGAVSEAFVMKLNPAGNAVVYAAWLGGGSSDAANKIAVDGSGEVVITGTTSSTDFPLKNALQPMRAGGVEAFVARLNASGSELVYSTLLGGSGNEAAGSVAIDASGNVYVSGNTDSWDFPLMNPLQAAKQGSAFYSSSDAGGNWTGAGNGLTASQTSDLAIDPTSPAIIYAATERGVYKTTNSGASWTRVGSSSLALPTSRLVIDPVTPATIYAIAGNRFWKSTDGGENWTAIVNTLVNSVAIDPVTSTTLYVGTGSGLTKSTNGGMTFSPISIPPVGGGGSVIPSALAIDPQSPMTVYAGTNRGMYKTVNGGTAWTFAGNGLPTFTSPMFLSIAISRSNPSTIFAMLRDGFFKTTDGGNSWNPVTIPLTPLQYRTLAVDPSNPNIVYVGTQGLGIYKSTDGGLTWNQINNGLNGSIVMSVQIVTNSPMTIYAATNSATDGFVAKINPAGSALVYSTYLGGGDSDFAASVAVDATGNAYVGGTTQSKNFPTANAYQSALKGVSDAFVAKLNPAGSALLWSTYLGGDVTETCLGLAINSAGNVFITGTTASTNFPTVNAAQSNNSGFNDAYVTRFSADGQSLEYSTYLGGSMIEFAQGIAVDAASNAYVTGLTTSSDFPVANAAQPTPDPGQTPGVADAFITKLSASGSALLYSTYLGGSSSEQGNAIAVDAAGNVYVVGYTNSSNFPLTPNPLRSTFSQREAFITKLAISADLTVAINDEPDPVQVNGNLAYTVTIANNGPDPAANVTATITLPQAVIFVSANTSQGSCTGNSPVNCALGNLAANANVTIILVVTPTAAGNITLQTSAASAIADINTANNTASQTTKVSTLPSIFGRVTIGLGNGLSGVMMNLGGTQRPVITTSDDGRYQFAELAAGGNYTVTPSRQGYVFNPANRAFNNLTTDQRSDFSAVACVFSITPSNLVFPSVGGTGSIRVNSPDVQCPWTARSNAAWIKLSGAANGIITGNGSQTVNFTVDPTVGARSGTITIAENTFTVLQEFNACATADFSTSPVSVLPQAGYFLRILAADFNKDAVPDLAAINNNLTGPENQATLLVYPSNPAGGFAAPIKAMTLQGGNASFQAFAAGDLNGDGFRDFVATGGQNQNRIFVVLSDGAGGFLPFKEYADTFPLFAVAIGDFNSDNKPDVAFGVRSFEANVIVRLNDGAGNLGDPKILAKAGGNFPVDQVEVADFDGDNKLDIVSFAQGPEFIIHKGDGAGNFSAQPQILPAPTGARSLGDFNGDRRPDVLFTGFNEMILYLSNGMGQFSSPTRIPLSFPFITSQSGLIAGDFNGDGRTDAGIFPNNSTNSYNEGMLTFLSIGNGGFAPPTWYLPIVGGSLTAAGGVLSVAEDFNRDGLADMLFAQNNSSANTSSITIATATQSGLTLPRMFPFSGSDSGSQSSPSAIASADLNGDGVIDLATTNFSSANVSLLPGRGRGEFGNPIAIPTGFDSGGAIDLAIRDFNRDGNRDLVVLSASANTIVVLLGNGRGEFSKSATLTVGPNARQLGVADFNNDGNLDLIARTQAGGLALFTGNGQGGFTAGQSGIGGNLGDFDQTFVIGDFNGDTNADLVLADGNQAAPGPRLILLSGNGQGGFAAPKTILVEGRYNLVAAADFNLDGKDDLAYLFGSILYILLSTDEGSFAAPTQYPVGGDTRYVTVRDVNGDAKPDIIAAGQSSQGVYVLIGKGDGAFNTASVVPLPGLPNRVAADDFNGDGSVDFAVVRGSSTIGAILLNRASCPPAGAAVVTSAASYQRYNLASESIAALFGTGLAQSVQVASSVPLPTSLGGTSVRIKDSAGVERAAPLFFISPNQINFQIPPGAAAGTALVSVINGSNVAAVGTLTINRLVPALFSADTSGQGFASAVVLRVKADGTQIFEPVTAPNGTGQIVAIPIDLGPESDQVFVLLFGSGLRGNTGLANVSVTIAGSPIEVQYAGAQGDFVGLDQVNLKLPRSISGRGLSTVVLTVDGKTANPVNINIK